MGLERESIWKAKYTHEKLLRSCPCPTVPWERGCSLSLSLLLLYSTLLLTCPWALSAEREWGRGALRPEHLLESQGVRTPPGIAQRQLHRQTLRFCSWKLPSLLLLLRGRGTHNFSAHMRHLLVCCLPEASRTGAFSLVQDRRPPASNWERNSLQSSCGRRAGLGHSVLLALLIRSLETWGFPARKAWNHHKCITGDSGWGWEKRVCSTSHLAYKQRGESEKFRVLLPAQHVLGVFYAMVPLIIILLAGLSKACQWCDRYSNEVTPFSPNILNTQLQPFPRL